MADDTELTGLCRLLSAWPRWRVRQPRPGRASSPSPWGLKAGEWIRRLHFFRFGVAFEGDLALLRFRCPWRRPGQLSLQMIWQGSSLDPAWRVFVHFLDSHGEICFQGDHTFGTRLLDPLGFLYYAVPVAIPKDIPPGEYAIRMGIWWPEQQRHLRVYGFRGVRQEEPSWCENSVYVGVCRID